MEIKLKRRTEVAGAFLKFKVRVNNDYVTSIVQGEMKDVSLPNENSEIQIKQLSGKSNKLVVNDGDTVEITNGPWQLVLFVLAVMLVPIATLFDGPVRLISIIIVTIAFVLVTQLINSYTLTKS